jgi:hypothetical protein
LIKQRRALPPKGIFRPDSELVAKWAEQFDMPELRIYQLIRTLNGPERAPVYTDFSGELRTVVPVMKEQEMGPFHFKITHLMQYEKWSELHLVIRYTGIEEEAIRLDASLTMEIRGGEEAYEVRAAGGQENNYEVTKQFHITPTLPECLDELTLALVPIESMRPKSVEIKVLNEPLSF